MRLLKNQQKQLVTSILCAAPCSNCEPTSRKHTVSAISTMKYTKKKFQIVIQQTTEVV